MNNIALFDWDKTVRKDYACLKWLKMIVEAKIVDEKLLEDNEAVYQKYLKGVLNHNQLTEDGMKVYCSYVKDVKKADILPVLQEYKKQDSGNIFEIMREYIFPFLVENNIKIIIISGAQQELIELYKEELKINEIYGVQYKVVNGKYTSDYINNGLDDNKKMIVNNILSDKENRVLFSFGDSISDIPLLKVAKRSFINNTKTKFFNGENAVYYDFNKIENGPKMIKEMEKVLMRFTKNK